MIAQWHQMIADKNVAALPEILADNVVLHSPVIHRKIVGPQMVGFYLTAAFKTFLNDSFRYVKEFNADNSAVLEFVTTIDDVEVNGIDMITWDSQGKIIDFKVMVRPLKAINKINDNMTAMLEALKTG